MKKRDYYILAILAGLILYSALHRNLNSEKAADKIDDLLNHDKGQKVLSTVKDTSTASVTAKIIRAEI